jgi:hypothetical protein
MAEWFRVTLEVRVTDKRALYFAALKRARADGMTAAEYQQLRREPFSDPVRSDLQMLLDPGESPDGCELESSEVESAGEDDG